jgi:hypothetical protein
MDYAKAVDGSKVYLNLNYAATSLKKRLRTPVCRFLIDLSLVKAEIWV